MHHAPTRRRANYTIAPGAIRAALCIAALCTTRPLRAQEHVHVPGMTHPMPAADSTAPKPPAGQAAFAAIADVVRQLEADSTTDWSRVNIERLLQHLIDMDEVIMHADVLATKVSAGARFTVRGAPRTATAIKRMLTSHAAMLGSESGLIARVQPLPDGAVFTVTAKDGGAVQSVDRIRALGFAGLLTLGEHHAAHHLALARGDTLPGH